MPPPPPCVPRHSYIAGGAILFGLAIFAFLFLWLRFLKTEGVTQVVGVVTLVFGMYYVGEFFMGVSGVLTVVVFGLCFGSLGQFTLTGEAEVRACVHVCVCVLWCNAWLRLLRSEGRGGRCVRGGRGAGISARCRVTLTPRPPCV